MKNTEAEHDKATFEEMGKAKGHAKNGEPAEAAGCKNYRDPFVGKRASKLSLVSSHVRVHLEIHLIDKMGDSGVAMHPRHRRFFMP